MQPDVTTGSSQFYYNDPNLYLDTYYSTHYFDNLTENFGNNIKGSCTYVSFAMLLSYYDTYWDDDVIPENYDMNTMLENNALSFDVESPGIYQESSDVTSSSLTTEEYYQRVEQYSNYYLHLKLIQMGKELFQQYQFDNTSSPCGLTNSQLQELASYYLYNYLGMSNNDVVIENTTSNVREFAIQQIKEGNPVLIRMGSTTGGGHAFILYDYNETTDELYGHMGWNGNYEHIALSTTGYSSFWDATVLNFNTSQECSNNFKYSDGYTINQTHSPCELYTPFNMRIVEGDYLDELPTFKWDLICLNDDSEEYDLYYLNSDKNEIVSINNLTNNEYTLKESEWASLISCFGKNYYAYVVAKNSEESLEFTSINYTFSEPDDFYNKDQIKPEEWGFAPQYYYYEKQKSIVENDLTIDTERLRCGYIEEQYVILSPRRENAGEAYLEMTWDSPVYSYMFGVALWSSNEYLSSYDSDVTLEELDASGVWSESMDLLNDINLPTKNQQIDRYESFCKAGIYGLRFSATTSAIGDRNKGRICLDDIVLNTDINDLGFISTFYD